MIFSIKSQHTSGKNAVQWNFMDTILLGLTRRETGLAAAFTKRYILLRLPDLGSRGSDAGSSGRCRETDTGSNGVAVTGLSYILESWFILTR